LESMPLANMSVQAAVVGSAEMMEPMWRTFRLAPLMMHGERADEAEGCCQKFPMAVLRDIPSYLSCEG